jgi:hypothetical protein
MYIIQDYKSCSFVRIQKSNDGGHLFYFLTAGFYSGTVSELQLSATFRSVLYIHTHTHSIMNMHVYHSDTVNICTEAHTENIQSLVFCLCNKPFNLETVHQHMK